jgi:sterol desaturase/sphingolipid hydroxylase (fatty acid hydroxylase superfamily)
VGFWAEFEQRVLIFALALATIAPLEIKMARSGVSWRSRWRGLVFALILAAFSAAIGDALRLLWTVTGRPPRLLRLPLAFGWAGVMAPVLTFVAVALVADFWFYWFHRFQHRFLWRFHAVHHSIREMSASNENHHVSEALFNGLFLFIPASLVSWDYPRLPAFVFLGGLLSQYIHSPIDVGFGRLRAVLVDNRFHRIHHSLKREHFDRNFGGFTTIWDRLFGTAYWPARDEWPEIGVEGVDEPRTVWEWVTLPWRMRRAGTEASTETSGPSSG